MADISATIAIPSYNAADYIEAALRSACAQTLTAIEVIVVDDCSTDETAAIASRAAQHDRRISVVRMERNGGPAAARNRALDLARGEWFAVLDVDDLFAPDRLERLLRVARQRGADVIADNLVVFEDGAQSEAHFHLQPRQSSKWLKLPTYLAESRIYSGGADYGFLKPCFNSAALARCGLRYDERLRVGEDDDLVVRLLGSGLRYWLEPCPTYGYRKHDASISHRLSARAAAAMEAAALDLAAHPQLVGEGVALRLRWKSLHRARKFSELLEAAKRRDLRAVAAAWWSCPSMTPLLSMPAAAVLRRILRLPHRRHGSRVTDPSAHAALLAMQP